MLEAHGQPLERGVRRTGKARAGGRVTSVHLEGPNPYIDADDLPLNIALQWDPTCRHPLGRHRRFLAVESAPIDSSGDMVLLDSDVDGELLCRASEYMKCTNSCVLFRGCVPEDWLYHT